MKKKKILSVFWHRVESDSTAPDFLDGTNPTISIFKDQIEFLIKNHTPISIHEFLEALGDDGPLPSYAKPPVLLGFDDGFRSVIVNALPVLGRYGIPAVFFVIGGIVSDPEFVPWFIEVRHLIRRTRQRRVTYGGMSFDLIAQHDRTKLRQVIGAAFKACKSETQRQSLLTHVADILDMRRPIATELDENLCLVTKSDLASLNASSLLTVGSHAMTHRHLEMLTYDEQLKELQQSDAVLREKCPSYCPVIAYPAGSFNTTTMAIASEIYSAGFAASLEGSSYRNLYAYPRVGINGTTGQKIGYTLSPARLNGLLPLKRLLYATGLRRGDG